MILKDGVLSPTTWFWSTVMGVILRTFWRPGNAQGAVAWMKTLHAACCGC